MAVSAGVSGDLCTLSIVGSFLAESRNFTLTMNQALIDLSNRDSAWWSQFIQGMRDWEISGDGLYIYNDLAKAKLQNHYINRTPLTLTCILTLSAVNRTMTGECILTVLTYPAPHDDAATITFTLKGTDALAQSAS